MPNLASFSARRAEPVDAEAVAWLHADSWRRHYRGAYSDAFLGGDVEADRLLVWTERLAVQDGTTVTFMAEGAGEVVGFIHLVFDEDRQWGSLVDNLHVVWARKRAGIGTLLMAEAAAAVLDHGGVGLHLWVLEQNEPAQAFYSSRSGICTGRRPVKAPGGIPDRLNGTPHGLRYWWSNPSTLIL